MAEQTVTLNPGESKVVSFEVTPTVAKTYSVSVDGLTGSFKATTPPIILGQPFTFTTSTGAVATVIITFIMYEAYPEGLLNVQVNVYDPISNVGYESSFGYPPNTRTLAARISIYQRINQILRENLEQLKKGILPTDYRTAGFTESSIPYLLGIVQGQIAAQEALIVYLAQGA